MKDGLVAEESVTPSPLRSQLRTRMPAGSDVNDWSVNCTVEPTATSRPEAVKPG
jgi:hypothetical protein